MVCGMGGSAIGGDLAAAALGDRLTRPLLTVRGYELPSWATPEWTVLCSSYSGNTEETLACFAAAEALGARRIVASTGGELVERAREAGVPVVGLPGIFQPRAAVAYMFVVAAEVAALAGVGAADPHRDRRRRRLPRASSARRCRRSAAEIADRLGDGRRSIYGADLTAPVARRWKTQINENAKLPAFFSELPEADHNEICGWAGRRRRAVRRRLPRRLRPAPARAPPLRADRRGDRRRAAPRWCGSRPRARPGSRACSGRRCWATSSRWSWPQRAGVDPLPVEAIERLKAGRWAGMRAMVLAAGLGTRLRPITYEMPKPMVPVLNRPVMEHILRLLARHGFTETIANLHWFPELIEGHFGDGSALRASSSPTAARSSCSAPPAGSATPPASSATPSSSSPATRSPTSTSAAMREFHESHDGIATLATKRVDDTSQFGVAITGADGRIQGFQEKPDPAEALSDLANCGIYMFRSEIFDFFPAPGTSKAAGPGDPAGFADWAMDVFPAPARGRRALLLARDRRLLERHRQPRGAARRATSTRCSGAVAGRARGAEVVDGVRSGEPAATRARSTARS